MLVRFKCTQCSTSVKVDSQHAGLRAKCPGCGVTLQIPTQEQIAAATGHGNRPARAPTAPSPLPEAARKFDDDDFEFDDNPYSSPTAADDPFGSPATEYEPTRAHRYGGFWIRVAAALIDNLISAFAGFIVGMLLGVLMFVAGLDPVIAQLLNVIIGTAIGWLYWAGLESSSMQGTVGKMAMGLKVVDLDGRRISFGRATGRYFAKILSSIFFIGFIMVAFTERKQGLHDLIAGTYVVRK